MTSHDGRSRKATRRTKSTKEQKMKSLKFFKPNLASTHYLFVALLFASFAVASVSAANLQRRIIIDYTTEPIQCAFNEQVALRGSILISFKRIGKNVQLDSASLESFEGVGLTTKREYVVDTVTLHIVNLSQLSPGLRLLMGGVNKPAHCDRQYCNYR